MATSVATPLERQFGRIAGVTEMTSTSSLGSTSITLQFDLNRDIDARRARRAGGDQRRPRASCPPNLPSNPTYRKVNPADAPIMILALTSDTVDRGADVRRRPPRSCSRSCRRSRASARSSSAAARCRRCASSSIPRRSTATASASRTCARCSPAPTPTGPRAQLADGEPHLVSSRPTTSCCKAAEYQPLIVAYATARRCGCPTWPTVTDSVEDLRTAGLVQRQAAVLLIIFRQPGANIIETVDRVRALLPQLQASIPPTIELTVVIDRTRTIRASLQRRRDHADASRSCW